MKDLAKELLDKLAKSDNGCTHNDFEHGHQLADENAFNAVLDIIRAGGADLLKNPETVKNAKPSAFDDVDKIDD